MGLHEIKTLMHRAKETISRFADYISLGGFVPMVYKELQKLNNKKQVEPVK